MYANFLLVFRARTSRIIIWFLLQPCHILLISLVLNATLTLPADMNSSALPSAAADPALYDNRYHTLMAGATALLVLPTLAVILRLLSRWIAGAGLWV